MIGGVVGQRSRNWSDPSSSCLKSCSEPFHRLKKSVAGMLSFHQLFSHFLVNYKRMAPHSAQLQSAVDTWTAQRAVIALFGTTAARQKWGCASPARVDPGEGLQDLTDLVNCTMQPEDSDLRAAACELLCRMLDQVSQPVPPGLRKLADHADWFVLACRLAHTHASQSGDDAWLQAFTAMPNLESLDGLLLQLDLSGCSSLPELGNSVGNLQSLRQLDISGCTALWEPAPEYLPIHSGSLQQLNISGCTLRKTSWCITELLESFTSLQQLNMSGCTSVVEIYWNQARDSFLQDLQVLNLSECTSLREITPHLYKVATLQQINLSGCTSLPAIPGTLGSLSALQQLDLSGCTSLQDLPPKLGDLRALQQLDISGCTLLKCIHPNLCNLSALQQLNLSGCTSLQELPPRLSNLLMLQQLDISGCTSLRNAQLVLGEVSAANPDITIRGA